MDTAMLFRLPFTYSVTFVKTGGRKPHTTIFGDWIELEVAEAATSETPVSMKWTELRDNQEFEREVRWFDGDNWQVAVPGGPTHPFQTFAPDDFRKLGEVDRREGARKSHDSRHYAYANATNQSYWDLRDFLSGGTARIEDYGLDRIRTVLETGRRDASEKLVRSARNLLFIDGQLWIRGKEPCYGIIRYKENEGVFSVYDSVDLIPADNHPDILNTFRADRYLDARDYAIEAFGETGVNGLDREIQVLIPEAVQFMDEDDALKTAASHIASMAYPTLIDAPDEAMVAWMALRTSLHSENPDMDAMADRLQTLSDLLGRDNQFRAIAERAIHRWNLRPLEADTRFPTP